MSTLVFVTFLLQAGANALTAAMLLYFWRAYRRPYLRLWGASWLLLSIEHLAAGAAFMLIEHQPPSHPARVALSSVSLIACGWQIVFLLLGTLYIARGRTVSNTICKTLLALAAGAAITAALATINADSETRRVVRVGLPTLFSAGAFVAVAAVALARRPSSKVFGSNVLAGGAVLYAGIQITFFFITVDGRTTATSVLLAEIAGMIALLLESMMAIGMVIWLLEEERQQASSTARALAASEQRFRGLVEHVRVIAWEFDPAEDRFTFVSPQAEAWLGWPREQWLQPGFWRERLHPDDRDQATRLREEHVQREADHELEYRMLKPDGSSVWFRDLTTVEALSPARPSLTDKLKPPTTPPAAVDSFHHRLRGAGVARNEPAIMLHGVLIDITARKTAETAMRASEARLRAVIDNTPNVGIQGYDRDARVVFWNRASELLFGWSSEEANGKTVDQLMLDAESAAHFLETLRAVERDQKPQGPMEWSFRRRDGTTGWCYSTSFTVGGDPPVFICMDVDITPRKHAEEALERSNELERLLLSELDHRVRNNLASLAALVDISARSSATVAEFAASISSRVRAMSVVHGLLSREHWRAVNLRELALTLSPVSDSNRLRLDGPDVAVLPRQATALGMVLQELFVNSQKHGSFSSDDGSIELIWRHEDSGKPVPAAHVVHLRWCESGGPAILTPPADGVGTGLIHGLIRTELQGAAILSYPAGGAQHTFTLVLDDESSAAAPAAPPAPAAPAIHSSSIETAGRSS